MPDPGPLRVVDQWAYHSRLYRAGAYAATVDNLAVLQLVSFGCGLDAITSDQLEEIVTLRGRLYAQIKIDEGANLGPARIRIRSLQAAMRERREQLAHSAVMPDEPPPAFTRDMRETHTLLVPQMSPLHFQFTEEVFASEGYRAVLLPSVSRAAIELGLRHVNNDACFPAIVVVGQLLEALKSGVYDPEKVALVISQTGGGCRATNYIGFLRKALLDEVTITQGPRFEAYAEAWLAENPGKSRLDVPPLKVEVAGRHLIMPGRRFCEYQLRAVIEEVQDCQLEKMPLKLLYLSFPFETREPMRLALYVSKMVLGDFEPEKGQEVDAYVWLQARIIDIDQGPQQ